MRSAYPIRAFCDLRGNPALSIRSIENDNEEICHGEITFRPRSLLALAVGAGLAWAGQARGGEHVIKIRALEARFAIPTLTVVMLILPHT